MQKTGAKATETQIVVRICLRDSCWEYVEDSGQKQEKHSQEAGETINNVNEDLKSEIKVPGQEQSEINEEWHKCRKGKQCSEEGESWCGAFHVGSPRHHRMSQLLHSNAGPSENFGTIAKPVEVQSQ